MAVGNTTNEYFADDAKATVEFFVSILGSKAFTPKVIAAARASKNEGAADYAKQLEARRDKLIAAGM